MQPVDRSSDRFWLVKSLLIADIEVEDAAPSGVSRRLPLRVAIMRRTSSADRVVAIAAKFESVRAERAGSEI